MPFIKTACPICKKTFESVKEFSLASQTVHQGKCGHLLPSDKMQHKSAALIESLDGKRLYPFQAQGAAFLESSNGRALIADEMGLGKTVQALAFLALHPEATPVLMIVKKSLGIQWQHEVMRWIGDEHFAQVISDSKTEFLLFLKYYIISFDLIPRIKGFKDKVEARGIKTIIIDECQQIKNPESNRTVAVRDLTRLKCIEHVIALSGTPIKNNAVEYFPILNILHPEIFPRLSQFAQWWCQSYWNGRTYKTGGLRDPKLFQEKTKSFIIRREFKDVKSELPTATDPIQRRFSFHELGKEVEQAYIDEMKNFQKEFFEASEGFEKQTNILAFLTRMRRLAGLSLIDPCIDHVMEFVGSTERKLIIFVHHHDVAEILQMRLGSLMQELGLEAPIRYQAGMDGNKFVQDFKVGSRIAIISTLAGGEGLDGMQFFCSDLIMLERQWNPANEEQPEKRISQRIGQQNNVTGTYFIAIGTVVEFFSELVEQKRQYVVQTLGGEAVSWDESSLMKELSEVLAVKGGKKWGF